MTPHLTAIINRWPKLSRAEEAELATQWRDHQDKRAFEQLVGSNLAYVLKVAHRYKGYGCDLEELFQCGVVGLTVAARKFDPARGVRLLSFAGQEIESAMRDHVKASHSMVKFTANPTSKRLFFRLRSKAAELEATRGEVSDSELAAALGEASVETVARMRQRLTAKDKTLPATDRISANTDAQDDAAAREAMAARVRGLVKRATAIMSVREAEIVRAWAAEEKPRLFELAGSRRNAGGSDTAARMLREYFERDGITADVVAEYFGRDVDLEAPGCDGVEESMVGEFRPMVQLTLWR